MRAVRRTDCLGAVYRRPSPGTGLVGHKAWTGVAGLWNPVHGVTRVRRSTAKRPLDWVEEGPLHPCLVTDAGISHPMSRSRRSDRAPWRTPEERITGLPIPTGSDPLRLFLSGLVGLVAGRRWSPYPDLGEALAPAGHSEPDDASARVRVRRLPF